MSGLGNVFAVHISEVDELWDKIEPHLKRFERETQTTTAETIRAQALRNDAQIWGFQRGPDVLGVCVTKVYKHDNGLYCTVWAVVGELDDIIDDGLAMIERWAQSNGCVAIELIGRKGWLRRLPQYRQRAVVLEKDLRGLH